MTNRTFVYIDGESHFIRSQNAWRQLHGDNASLEHLRCNAKTDNGLVLVDLKAKIFWTRQMCPEAHRSYYFTSLSGDTTALFDVQVALRNFDLDPMVLPEHGQRAKQRQNQLTSHGIIEKAKCVDIELAVRMLEDSLNAYDSCHLYSSDVDFLPVIKAVRARGRSVYVHGYRDGLSDQSPLLHACDVFHDLGPVLRDAYVYRPPS